MENFLLTIILFSWYNNKTNIKINQCGKTRQDVRDSMMQLSSLKYLITDDLELELFRDLIVLDRLFLNIWLKK